MVVMSVRFILLVHAFTGAVFSAAAAVIFGMIMGKELMLQHREKTGQTGLTIDAEEAAQDQKIG